MTNNEYVGELSDVLEAVGEQLREANRKALNQTEGPVIGLDSATITLETVAQKEASGGLKVWVLDARAAAHESKTVKVEVHATALGLLEIDQ